MMMICVREMMICVRDDDDVFYTYSERRRRRRRRCFGFVHYFLRRERVRPECRDMIPYPHMTNATSPKLEIAAFFVLDSKIRTTVYNPNFFVFELYRVD